MDGIPQMLCLFHSENIGRRRWYVGTRLSLYAQNSVSSGGVTVTSLGSQWGAVVCSQGPRLAAGAPLAPFCGGLEADGECGRVHAGYSAQEVFIVVASKTASTGDAHH